MAIMWYLKASIFSTKTKFMNLNGSVFSLFGGEKENVFSDKCLCALMRIRILTSSGKDPDP